MASTEQYQAWVHLDSGDRQYVTPVGPPQPTAQSAWREAHNIAIHFWPEDRERRRIFESRCKVLRETANGAV